VEREREIGEHLPGSAEVLANGLVAAFRARQCRILPEDVLRAERRQSVGVVVVPAREPAVGKRADEFGVDAAK
jgi:hypothetical protein